MIIRLDSIVWFKGDYRGVGFDFYTVFFACEIIGIDNGCSIGAVV